MDSRKAAFLFPGQGAQVVGMGQSLHSRHEVVRELFLRASNILGYDLAEICFSGPVAKLDSTEFSQPALFVCSMAAVDALRLEKPELTKDVTCAAGLSLGEYSAVCFAGGLDFESALRLVQRRGQAMQAAADLVDSGMASVLGLELDALHKICDDVRNSDEVLQPANILCPGNIAVSGHKSALARLEPEALKAGAMKVIPLSVAGAFHTPLMNPAVQQLETAISETTFGPLQIPVYSNVDAAQHLNSADFRQLLPRQVVSPVLWESSIRVMMGDGVNFFVEVGTGRVLRGTLKRIDRKLGTDGFGDD